MSYEEVARGLPPVGEVIRGPWEDPRTRPISLIHPTWAIITPGTDHPANPSTAPTTPKRRSPVPTPRTNQLQLPPLEIPPIKIKKRPPPPPPTKRYIIQDGDDNSMKVIKLDAEASLPGTLELQPKKSRRSIPKLLRQGKSVALTIPKVRVTTSGSNNVNSPNPSSTAIARRARHFIIFLLTILPPLFFTVAVQYLKFNMAAYGIGLKGFCTFQAIFWPALVFLICNAVWLKLNVVQAIRTGWLELLILLLLSPAALILQIVSVTHLDITTALALTFAPLVIASFIKHISQDRSFSLELCVTSIMVYLGMTLIGLSILFVYLKQDQDQFLFGFTASVGNLMFKIPACLLLVRLRRRKIDDSVTAVTFALGGTVMSSIIVILTEFSPFGNDLDLDLGTRHEIHPGAISSLITFTFFGMIFQIIESKLNRKSYLDEDEDDENETQQNRDSLRLGRKSYSVLRLSKTRLGVFLLSGLWELGKLALGREYFPSPLSFFGVFFLILGYCLTVGYESWLRSMKQSRPADKIYRNRCHFLPWLFSRTG